MIISILCFGRISFWVIYHILMLENCNIWRIEIGIILKAKAGDLRIQESSHPIDQDVIKAKPLKVSLDFYAFKGPNWHRQGIPIFRLFLIFLSKSLNSLEFDQFLAVSFKFELLLESCNYLVGIDIFLLELLVVRTTLKTISRPNKVGHLLVKLVRSGFHTNLPSLLLWTHLLLVKVDISNVLHMLLIAPLSIPLPWNVQRRLYLFLLLHFLWYLLSFCFFLIRYFHY